MHHFALLVHRYGALIYPMTALWTFLEGESFVFVGGFAASLGIVDPWLLGLSAWVGSLLGDQASFALGRLCGEWTLRRRPAWRRRVDAAHAAIRRWQDAFILSFRFVYGVRNIAAFALGLGQVSWRRFAALNALGAAIWAAAFVGGGYVVGGLYGELGLRRMVHNAALTLVPFLGVVAIVVMTRRLRAEAKARTKA